MLNAAPKNERCVYQLEDGRVKQVPSLGQVPSRYQASAVCGAMQQSTYLAPPEEIKLNGTVRKESMSTAIGPISMRWPRKVETLFGRTPERALVDAASTVGRALRQAGFKPEIQSLNVDWTVVFLDEEVPETQIPAMLVTNCHPAWMTPIANLYVVGQRVVAGCGGGQSPGGKVADAELATVLLHEIGHGVEYQILKGGFEGDKMRAEGFATWFETFASGFSSVIPKGQELRQFKQMALRQLETNHGKFNFNGSGEDYARASMYFHVVVDKRGVKGLMDIYDSMLSKNILLRDAIKDAFAWDNNKLEAEVERFIRS